MNISQENLERAGIEYIRSATEFDLNKDWPSALFFYREGCSCLLEAQKHGSKIDPKKIRSYIKRSEAIAQLLNLEKEPIKKEKSELSKAQFLLQEALDQDYLNNTALASELYLDAVELCLKAKKTCDKSVHNELSKLAREALSRVEFLKSKKPTRQTKPTTEVSNKDLKNVGSSTYSKEELSVIGITSKINGIEYVPFLNVDLNERFALLLPYEDSCGHLNLALKQRNYFYKWVRISELCAEPKIIDEIEWSSVRQAIISDCSFIASLTVAAHYEKKYQKKIITHIIYPQNLMKNPVYNPSGKYMIKLQLNGLDRKIIIDDYLPVDRQYNLLCSHSVKKNEFWVSLLEKAYMKVMGGYDFPGSNSTIDLNALTGWIPEAIYLNEKNSEETFRLVKTHYHLGNILVTVATRTLDPDTERKSGLVSGHAYALLDIREVDGIKLILLKNPWQHREWKGNYSDQDDRNWTPSLLSQLKYNRSQTDNGVFWIDYFSLCNFFTSFHLNWRLSLFKYTFATHRFWSSKQGPVKDLYTLGENPQFRLHGSTQMWILLTRHIVDKHDFEKNKEFISLIVYKGQKKVYYRNSPAPFIHGVCINSPHYLVKIPADDYILVISQYEKTTSIYYTLRGYSNEPFTLEPIVDPYHYIKKINGEWNEYNAGGSLKHNFTINPEYELTTQGDVLLELKAPREYYVLISVKGNNGWIDNGPYTSGYNMMELKCNGSYNVIVSTYEPECKGPYVLIIKSTSPINVKCKNITN